MKSHLAVTTSGFSTRGNAEDIIQRLLDQARVVEGEPLQANLPPAA